MDDLISIGELARRTGVATSALRYYEEVGLLRPAKRIGDRRRYAVSAVDIVGIILLLRDVGFTLAEIKKVMSSRRTWRTLVARKVDELQRTIDDAIVARTALEHAMACPKDHMTECPNFWTLVSDRLTGRSVRRARSTTRTAGSGGSPRASLPSSPGGRAR